MVISSEDVQKIKNYTKDITKTVRSVNDLNMVIKDFEHSAFETEKENRSLKYEIELKDIDEEYRTTLINFAKYKLVMFVMAKLMEMETTEQNKVAMYLFNCIKI